MASDGRFRSRDPLAPVRRACALQRPTNGGEVVGAGCGYMESSVRRWAGTGLRPQPRTVGDCGFPATSHRRTSGGTRRRRNEVTSAGSEATGSEQSQEQSQGLPLPRVRQDVSTFVDAVHASADPHRHAAVSVPVLQQEISSEVWHEETHLHTYR